MTDDGSTALSVLMKMNASTPARADASATSRVPRTFVQVAAATFASDSGTCFCAAAWKTTAGCSRAKTRATAASSVTSPMTAARSIPSKWRRSYSSM